MSSIITPEGIHIDTTPGEDDVTPINTGSTHAGDSVDEWYDEQSGIYGVTLSVARRDIGIAELEFCLPSMEAAHALYLALCEVQDIQEYL